MKHVVYVYPDGEHYDDPPNWKSGDYEIRRRGYCSKCGEDIIPHYGQPFASCKCETQEWYQ